VVDDPYSDQEIYLSLGPTPVHSIIRDQTLPYEKETSGSTSDLSASLKVVFDISNDRSEGQYPHFKLTVPMSASRNDNKNGLVIHGCFGFIWRTIASNVYGYRLNTYIGKGAGVSHLKYDIQTKMYAYLIPSALDIDSLVATLSRQISVSDYQVSAPSGTQVYIVMMKCFKIEDATLKTFATTLDKPWDNLHGVKIYTYMVFPGRTQVSHGVATVNYLSLSILFDPRIYVMTALGTV
jgi:hypothetical protein